MSKVCLGICCSFLLILVRSVFVGFIVYYFLSAKSKTVEKAADESKDTSAVKVMTFL